MNFEKMLENIKQCNLLAVNDSKKQEENLVLDFLLNILTSGIKIQQIKAIGEINNIISDKVNLYSWLNSKKVLEIIIKTYDKEFYSRLSRIFDCVSINISKQQIDLISTSFQYPDISELSINLLCNGCRNFNSQIILYIFSRFSIESFSHIRFAKEFTTRILNQSEFPIEKYPVMFFKDLLKDEHLDFHDIAISSLVNIYKYFAFSIKLDLDISIYIQEIKNNTRAVQNIKLILNLNENGVRVKNLVTEDDISTIIKNMSNIKDDNCYSYNQEILSRLEFFEFCFKVNKSIEFTDFQHI